MLTPKKQRFADEYLVDLNATQAAIRAGYSARTAASQGERLLRDVEVRQAIEHRRREREQRTEITADRVLNEASRLAFFDARKLFNADGSPKAPHELDDDTAAALAGIEVVEQYEGTGKNRSFVGYVRKYRITDKNAALDKLMKHLGMFEKDNSQAASAAAAAAAAATVAVAGTDYVALRRSLIGGD